MSLLKGLLVVGVGALGLLARLVLADETPPVPKEAATAAVAPARARPRLEAKRSLALVPCLCALLAGWARRLADSEHLRLARLSEWRE